MVSPENMSFASIPDYSMLMSILSALFIKLEEIGQSVFERATEIVT